MSSRHQPPKWQQPQPQKKGHGKLVGIIVAVVVGSGFLASYAANVASDGTYRAIDAQATQTALQSGGEIPTPTPIPYFDSMFPAELDESLASSFGITVVERLQGWPGDGPTHFYRQPDFWTLYRYHYNSATVEQTGNTITVSAAYSCGVLVASPGSEEIFSVLSAGQAMRSSGAWKLSGEKGNMVDFALALASQDRNDPRCRDSILEGNLQ